MMMMMMMIMLLLLLLLMMMMRLEKKKNVFDEKSAMTIKGKHWPHEPSQENLSRCHFGNMLAQ
jgi:hypothetical protein